MTIVRPKPKVGVMIRISPDIRQKVKAIVKACVESGEYISEADFYRTAIEKFLTDFSTESREDEPRYQLTDKGKAAVSNSVVVESGLEVG